MDFPKVLPVSNLGLLKSSGAAVVRDGVCFEPTTLKPGFHGIYLSGQSPKDIKLLKYNT